MLSEPTQLFPIEDTLKQEQIAEAKDSRELAVFARGETYRRTSVTALTHVKCENNTMDRSSPINCRSKIGPTQMETTKYT
jgi:hypothetical protein